VKRSLVCFNKHVFQIFTVGCHGQGMPSECRKFLDVFNPAKCCEFPYPLLPESLAKACDKVCKDNPTASECCFAECINEKANFVVDGKIKAENVLPSFERHIRDGNFSKDTWTPVFDKSFEACNKMGE
jgi:hypothetical protein